MRAFGKTGWKLPILAMGGSAMVKQWVQAYGVKLLSTEERVAMVRHAYDRGIRYFDTARVYGESESIIGKGLKDVRKNVFLATKIYVMRPADTRKCLERSLKELGTDQVETAQIHSPVIEAMGFKGAMKVHAELLKLRNEKMLRYIGLTTHVAFETVHQMISTGGFDQCLLAYGYFRKGMDTLLSNHNIELRELCLAKAHELGMGILAMKVMGASVFGHNAQKHRRRLRRTGPPPPSLRGHPLGAAGSARLVVEYRRLHAAGHRRQHRHALRRSAVHRRGPQAAGRILAAGLRSQRIQGDAHRVNGRGKPAGRFRHVRCVPQELLGHACSEAVVFAIVPARTPLGATRSSASSGPKLGSDSRGRRSLCLRSRL